MKVKEVIWFAGRDCIGIVATENDMGEINFFIGKGKGFDKELDSQTIADWGTRVNKEMLDRFFNRNS